MPIPRREITREERRVLENKYDGQIPPGELGPRYDLPKTREELGQLLGQLSIEADAARKGPTPDVKLATINHEMEIVREALLAL